MTSAWHRQCRLCDGTDLERVLDLGHHPLADRFLTAVDLEQPEATYPLALDRCGTCGYVGLSYIVPAEQRYQVGDYSYTAGNSSVAEKHFAELADSVAEQFALDDDDLVVDIGGNDGTLLDAFRTFTGCDVLNIEPSINVGHLATERGIRTYPTLWGPGTALGIETDGGASVITATNVLNHASDPREFVLDVARALRPGGVFVFEVPSLHELMRQCAFDTVYLEHVSYFGLRQLERLLGTANLGIVHAETVDYMGGSLRVFAKAGGGVHQVIPDDPDPDVWSALALNAEIVRYKLGEKLHDIVCAGGRAVAIGAAAKGNTLLNWCRLGPHLIDGVADASPHKIGKFTPGSHIPIVADRAIGPSTTHALILPWNIAGFLKEKLAHLELEFIVPGEL